MPTSRQVKALAGRLLLVCLLLPGCGPAPAEVESAQPDCGSVADSYRDYDARVSADQVRPRATGFYVASFSWAPDYCATVPAASRQPGQRNHLQCGSGRQWGYILHGLWPQGSLEHPAEYPRACEGDQPKIDAAVLQPFLCMTPSAALLQHEFEYHGTCMHDEALETPQQYFAAGWRIFQRLTLPGSPQRRELGGVETWLQLNPELPAEALYFAPKSNEWRICLDQQFEYMACPESRSAATGSGKADCPVKGNISRRGRRLYFTRLHRDYERVVIDSSRGEQCFADPQAAIDAGWSAAP